MVVRLKLEVRKRLGHQDRIVEFTAIANAGFEASYPILIVTSELWEKLGDPPPEGFTTLKFGIGESREYPLIIGKTRAKVSDRRQTWTKAYIVNVPGIEEPLISDYLLSELKIVILDPKAGYWRFRDDPSRRKRRSVKLSGL